MKRRALGLRLLALVVPLALALALAHAPARVAHAAPRPPASSPAAPSPSAPSPSEDRAGSAAVGDAARQRFAEGIKHYAKKRYDRALAAFLQAYALTKNPAILSNLGMTSLKLGDPLHALRYFEQFLHDSSSATPEQRTRAEAGIAEARRSLGSIEIAAPDGADVAVDGEPVGRAPLGAPVAALPGEHTVTITTASGAKLANIEVKAGMVARLKLAASGPAAFPPSAVSSSPAPSAPASSDDDPTVPKRPPPSPSAEPAAPGLFAPPETIAPVYVAGVIGLGTLSAAIILRGIGANADRNTSVALDALGRNGKDAAACTGTVDASLAAACSSLRSGERASAAVTTPFAATLAIGAASTLFALGWYVLAPKSAPKVGTNGLIVTF